jgi:DMSO/TMAO reductase YedYZ molybdopterin-dependent catalytic subunit
VGSSGLDRAAGPRSFSEFWAGVRLDRLIGKSGGTRIHVVSVTGYDRRFDIVRASSLLLATRIGGQTLDLGHGFPARLVVSEGRGFWWVKWVSAIEVDDVPHWWELPFPLP